MKDFIRGYFDGDGCISIKNRIRIDFTSNKVFLEELKSYLEKKGILSNKVVTRKKNELGGSLQITKLKYVGKLYHYMYDNSTIYLERKYDKFQTFVNEIPAEENSDASVENSEELIEPVLQESNQIVSITV